MIIKNYKARPHGVQVRPDRASTSGSIGTYQSRSGPQAIPNVSLNVKALSQTHTLTFKLTMEIPISASFLDYPNMLPVGRDMW